MYMKTILNFFVLAVLMIVFQSLIMRHDVADEKYIQLAKQHPQVCYLPN